MSQATMANPSQPTQCPTPHLALPTHVYDADVCVVAAPYVPQLSPASNVERTPDLKLEVPTKTFFDSRSPTLTSPLQDTEHFQKLNARLASSFIIFFVFGWGDGVTGTLLPYFKSDFHLSFMTSSLCFVATSIGFGIGTILLERILHRMGRISADLVTGHSSIHARFVMVVTGTLLHPLFFIIMGCRRNFGTMLFAYVISAFSRSMLSATMNHYVASTPKKALGYMYGYWSIGSMCAPLVCQSIIAKGIAWNHFYFGSLVLSAISSTVAFYAFRPTTSEIEQDVSRIRAEALSPYSFPKVSTSMDKQSTVSPISPSSEETIGLPKQEITNGSRAPDRTLLRALKIPYVWAFAIFCGIYTGTEASTQGFIVTYLLNVRNADPKTVGYTTSGFWGGLAVSRFIWGYFNPRLTYMHRKRIVHICMSVAFGLHLTIWFVRSFVGNAFSTAVIGFAYGPIFVGNIAQANEILPKDLQMISMQIIVSCGSFGSALFPFITGTLLNYKGPQTLTYVLVAQTCTLFILWSFFRSPITTR